MSDSLQFCLDDHDITALSSREVNANQVFVWDDGLCVVVAVAKSDTDGTWSYLESEDRPDPSWDINAKFRTWRAALNAFGFGDVR